MRWHCPRRADYLLQLWPDGAVVYDEASGDIHALSPIAGELLQQLLTVQQSCAKVWPRRCWASSPPPGRYSQGGQVAFEDFEYLGFIEPCDA